MAKAFLSHSSSQKELVTKVSQDLGSKSIIDSKSFEEGMKNLEEILTALDSTDLFVLFISNESLNSKWVKEEILIAKEKLDEKYIKRIFPIIIDKNITHNDNRIPEWMAEEYNLKPILREGKIVKVINRRLREIVWEKHPRIKLRDQLFVGRNEQLNKFEERIDDINKENPIAIFTTGFSKIGKRSFMKKALLKANIIFKESYDFPIISLTSRESIEDFIIKIYDLGFSEKREFPNFLEIGLDKKIEIALELIADCQISKEIILIEDNGCLITPEGILVSWFTNILKSINSKGLQHEVTLCISSNYRLRQHTIINFDEVFALELQELNNKEKSGLLKRCAQIFEIDIDTEQLKTLSDNLIGFPEQIFYCINFIESTSVKEAIEQIEIIQDYNKENFRRIVDEIEKDGLTKNVLSILTEFDFISYELLSEITEQTSDSILEDLLRELNNRAVIEYIGADKDYLRLNEGIKNFLMRANYSIDQSIKDKLKKHIEKFTKEDNMVESDVSDFFYSLKGALLNDYKFQNKLLLPSHYLKTMIFLYEKDKDYKKVVILADRVLEKEAKIDLSLLREIKNWLCLALARLKDDRFKTEVQFFYETPEYHFLFGFYYRMISKPEFALEQYNIAIKKRPNFSRAQRELVQVLLNLELFDQAYDQAKFNYENFKDNPYHIQAYFDCLVRRSPKENEAKLLILIDELRKINTPKAKEMAQMAEADYYLFVRENNPKALEVINDTIREFGIKNFSLRRKFNILEKSKNIQEMENVVTEYERKYASQNTNELNILNVMKIKLSAHKGQKEESIRILNTKLSYFPQEYRDHLLEVIQKI